jgi:hypothetical protein
MYGVVKQDYYLFLSNSQGTCAPSGVTLSLKHTDAGFVLGVFFSLSALQLSDAAGRRLLERSLVGVFTLLSLLLFIAGYLLTECRAEHFLGGCCTTAAIAFYAMPLSSAMEVVRSRSAASLSLPLCCASLANASAWGLYGLSQGDAAIIAPNVLGVGCSLMQLVLIQRFRDTSPAEAEGGDDEARSSDRLVVGADAPPMPAGDGADER